MGNDNERKRDWWAQPLPSSKSTASSQACVCEISQIGCPGSPLSSLGLPSSDSCTPSQLLDASTLPSWLMPRDPVPLWHLHGMCIPAGGTSPALPVRIPGFLHPVWMEGKHLLAEVLRPITASPETSVNYEPQLGEGTESRHSGSEAQALFYFPPCLLFSLLPCFSSSLPLDLPSCLWDTASWGWPPVGNMD